MAVSPEGKLVDYYTPANRAWVSKKDLDMGNISPVVFPYNNLGVSGGLGERRRHLLLDAKQLGGADHRTPLFRSPDVRQRKRGAGFRRARFLGSAGHVGRSERDAVALRACLWTAVGEAPKFPVSYGPAPAGSIMAFKVDEKDNKPVLVPAWISRDMSVPEPPIVANGVVFALSNGENVRQVDSGGKILSPRSAPKRPPATRPYMRSMRKRANNFTSAATRSRGLLISADYPFRTGAFMSLRTIPRCTLSD